MRIQDYRLGVRIYDFMQNNDLGGHSGVGFAPSPTSSYRVALSLCALLACLQSAPARAETLSPPEGARLVGSEPSLRLAWEGNAKDYYLQVLAAGRGYYDGPVTGNSFQL